MLPTVHSWWHPWPEPTPTKSGLSLTELHHDDIQNNVDEKDLSKHIMFGKITRLCQSKLIISPDLIELFLIQDQMILLKTLFFKIISSGKIILL